MKKITQTLLLLLVLVASVSSCKKSSDPAVAPAVAIIGKWKAVSASVSFLGQESNSPIDACAADDITEFFTSPKVTVTDGALKCDPSDPAVTNGSYTLSADGKTLVLDGFTQTVVELSPSTMKLKMDILGIPLTTTYSKI